MPAKAKNTSVKTSAKPTKAAEAPVKAAEKAPAAAGKYVPKKSTKSKSPYKSGKPNPNHAQIVAKIASEKTKSGKGKPAPSKPQGVTKANAAAKANKQGTHTKVSRKIRTNTRFHRPITQRLGKAPKYPRVSNPQNNNHDEFDTLKHPLTTESAMKKIEESNTLVFIVAQKTTKAAIKKAVRKLYDVKAAYVNTLIGADGQKRAYVRLVADSDALDVASKIGII
ncbi:putative 60S ribosomal protein L23 [Planoprotostelium fungivorum]|uniref:Putative 60S ribosomal protein L23 n=1 Tax=Planoprotostelium fungivorum TaxID=1890364 RepID=A0A2P6MPB7_9EUKA|nr:putative 60S ribosomal protein L23 [Planoprotostelium fungivorum]